MAVGLKTLQIVHKMHQGQQPLNDSTSILETNFVNFNISKFGIYPRTFRVVSATKQVAQGIKIYTSSRDTPIIREYFYSKSSEDSNLKTSAVYDLSKLASLFDYTMKQKHWIFDLQTYEDSLYVSFVAQPQSLGACDDYRIVEIPIVNGKLQLNKVNSIWKFDQCISSFPNYPGWHDFQGRLSVSKNNVYMTAGLIVASTYEGFYPSPFLSGLLPALEEEIARDKLYGGLIQVNKKTTKSKLFATGFRGPSGITIKETIATDTIWVADHGPRGGDELNLVDEGKNYGWPWVSYGTKYFDSIPGQSGYIDTNFANHEGYTKPRYYWVPSIAPSQLVSLNANYLKIPTWDNSDLLMGSLKAESLFHINVNEANYIESIEQIPIGNRIRDLSIEKGMIIMTTDDGQLMILSPNASKLSVGAFPPIESISATKSDTNVLDKANYLLERIGLSIQYRGTQLYRSFFSD